MESLNKIASNNDDIRRLIDKGYAVSLDSSCLVVRDIPYVDAQKNLHIGAIVSKLIVIDTVHVKLEDHQIFFCGSHPSELDGTPIKNMGGGPVVYPLQSSDLVVQRSFSNKPAEGFIDLYEKIESYVAIISGPAITLHNANPLTFRTVESQIKSVFNYADTLTSRAEIGDLTKNFEEDVIAIIGLGGTGSYLLDFMVKCPVMQIRGFDLDPLHVHNAFRSPGKLQENELGMSKADVYQGRYANFRQGVFIQPKMIYADSNEDLKGVTFAFVCVDKGSARAGITELLIKMNIPFIDVGMGLSRDKGPISGMLRTSYFPQGSTIDMLAKKTVPLCDLPDDIYHNNIQISELNALNACLAVIKYKQIRNFYNDDSAYQQILFILDDISASGE
jgi:hypothetical protein